MSRSALTELLARQITALGITQTEFARRVGAQQATVSRWLSGAVVPRENVVPLIAEVLQIHERELWVARGQAQEDRVKQSDRKATVAEQRHDAALEQVARFVDTYEAFHAAYRQMGEQIDLLVTHIQKLTKDVADLKRDVRTLRPREDR